VGETACVFVCVHPCHRVSLLESVKRYLHVAWTRRRGTFFLEKKESGEKKAKGTRQLVSTLFLGQV